MVYNVKVIDYAHGSQVRVYSHLMGVSNEDFNDLSCNPNNKKRDEEYILNNELLEIGFKTEKEKIKLVEEFTDTTDRVRDRDRSLVSSKNRTINNIYDIARSNDWEYFVTLTFDPQKVDSFNYDEVTKKLSKWLDNFRQRYAPELKYVVVPELHKSGRYHFHGLFTNIGDCSLVDSGHVDKSGNTIFNLGKYSLGWSTATIVTDTSRVASYIGKYITKDLCATTFGKKRYWASKNLDKPKVTNLCMNTDEIDNMIISLSNKINYEKKTELYDIGYTVAYYEIGE